MTAAAAQQTEFESNAAKLAILEGERAGLDTRRRIGFKIRFSSEAFAQHFAALLDLNLSEWEIEVSDQGSPYDWLLTLTCLMDPTAENVTRLSERFRKAAGRAYKGWFYNDNVDVYFEPSQYFDLDRFACARADALFGISLVEDCATGYQWNYSRRQKGAAFRLQPEQFIRHARAHRPIDPTPTASGFSQWLYSLYADASGTEHDRREGVAMEETILQARQQAYASVLLPSVRHRFPEWTLIHNGLHGRGEENPKYFEIKDLQVGGRYLRASPDLVFRNAVTGQIIIVEIKHSRMEIPSNLWPNIWGQLWCYAQIEMLRGAPKLSVVGEIWGDGWRKHSGRLTCLRASVRRDPRSESFDRFFRSLFDVYRGWHQ